MDTRKTMDRLNEIFDSIEACYMLIAKENELTYNALMLMLMIDYYDNLTQKQVCDKLFMPKSSVHSMLSDLIERGYLVLAEGGNKKEKYIIPTDSGKELIKRVVSQTEQMECTALGAVSEKELTAFLNTAQSLSEQIKKTVTTMYQGEKNA